MTRCLELVGGLCHPRHARDRWAADLVQAAVTAGVHFAGATAAGSPLLAYGTDNQAAAVAYADLHAAIRTDSEAIKRALFQAVLDDRMPRDLCARELAFMGMNC